MLPVPLRTAQYWPLFLGEGIPSVSAFLRVPSILYGAMLYFIPINMLKIHHEVNHGSHPYRPHP